MAGAVEDDEAGLRYFFKREGNILLSSLTIWQRVALARWEVDKGCSFPFDADSVLMCMYVCMYLCRWLARSARSLGNGEMGKWLHYCWVEL